MASRWRWRAIAASFIILLFVVAAAGRRFMLVLDDDEESSLDGSGGGETTPPSTAQEDLLQLEQKTMDSTPETDESEQWDTFSDFEDAADEDLDPGSWKDTIEDPKDSRYADSIRKLIASVSNGETELLKESIAELQAAASEGHPHAQSTLATLYNYGYGVEQNDLKAHLYHHFAAEGGNYQSKMALAYTYFRQQLYDQAAMLYSELAAKAISSLVSARNSPLVEPVRLNTGLEENKDVLKTFRGEDDDDFQFLEYQANNGMAQAMYKMGVVYYFGLRGVPRDHKKALSWFLKSADKGESRSLDFLGEIYARGLGVERDYTTALEYFKKAIREKRYSAYNGLGYLYYIGKGVDKRNLTRAKEFFKKAAEYDDPNGYYNLGVLYLKGAGVKKSIGWASRNFVNAANKGHPKAFYQLAKMQQKGIGMKKDIGTAVELYKLVAERGPWGSLLRWALESYLKGDFGLALLLYSRAGELGHEIAQSNAAWILEKYREEGVCLGQSGFCTDAERHRRSHTLWRYASEQGNEYAALLIGDAYYYGRGTEKDLERAVAAYRLAGDQRNPQAMFNLGYMHEHGLGLPVDFHLAKRYYDRALEMEPAALLPVYMALAGLWLRQLNENSTLVKLIDKLPEFMGSARSWVDNISLEGNATLITLVVCLLAVLYFRKQRQQGIVQEVPQ